MGRNRGPSGLERVVTGVVTEAVRPVTFAWLVHCVAFGTDSDQGVL
jgi:hypothetical protein